MNEPAKPEIKKCNDPTCRACHPPEPVDGRWTGAPLPAHAPNPNASVAHGAEYKHAGYCYEEALYCSTHEGVKPPKPGTLPRKVDLDDAMIAVHFVENMKSRAIAHRDHAKAKGDSNREERYAKFCDVIDAFYAGPLVEAVDALAEAQAAIDERQALLAGFRQLIFGM